MLDHHDIFVCDHFPGRTCKLDTLCGLEIDQIMLYDQFCQFIPCEWNHAIGNDASIFRDGNIRCSGSDIDQCDIQHTECFRDGNVNRCNRLQCHIGNFKTCLRHCRIQSVHNILRQKCHDDILTDDLCLMSFDVGINLLIQIVFHNRISHAVELVSCVIFLF